MKNIQPDSLTQHSRLLTFVNELAQIVYFFGLAQILPDDFTCNFIDMRFLFVHISDHYPIQAFNN